MPTYKQLEKALRNADASGNVEDAKILANALYNHPTYKVKQDINRMRNISPIGYGLNVLSGAKKELGGIGGVATQILPRVAKSLVIPPWHQYYMENIGKPAEQRQQEAWEKVKGVVTSIPKVGKEVISDIGESYGYKSGQFSPRITQQKFMNKPIETALDLVPVVGGGLKLGKAGLKALMKPSMKGVGGKIGHITESVAKETAEKAAQEEASKLAVMNPKEELFDVAKDVLKIDKKQLSNPNYGPQVGKRIFDDAKKINDYDIKKMGDAIERVKDKPVSLDNLKENLATDLKKIGLVDKDGTISNVLKKEYGDIDSELTKKLLINHISAINEGRIKNMGDVKRYMDVLDDKINWNNPKALDKGLIKLRKQYREILATDPNYDKVASMIHDKYNDFEAFFKKAEKIGGGEAFGKYGGFKTKEEYDRFLKFLEKHPSEIAGRMKGNTKALNAWAKYQRVMAPSSEITNLPLTGKADATKRVLDTVIPRDALMRKRLQLSELRKQAPSKTSVAIPTRFMLEMNNQE